MLAGLSFAHASCKTLAFVAARYLQEYPAFNQELLLPMPCACACACCAAGEYACSASKHQAHAAVNNM
jgi:hypothetical protein